MPREPAPAQQGAPIDHCLSLVTVGILFLPIPGVAAHFLDAELGLPAKFLVCLFGVAVAGGDVAYTAGLDAVGHLDAVYFFKGVYHVEYGVAVACTQVVNGESALVFDGLEGAHVARGEVANVNVVANASTIGGVVVVAEHAEFLADAHGGLRDVRH